MLILAFADDVKTCSIHIGHQCLYEQLETHKYVFHFSSRCFIFSRGQQVTCNRLFLLSVHFYENLFE